MASSSATLVVKILSDASGATKGMAEAEGAAGKLSGTMQALGGVIAAGALLKLGSDAVSAASDLQQATGAVEAVFGAYADGVKEAAAEAATAVGLSAASYSQLAAVIGSQLKNAGKPMDQVASSTDELIKLGADLAAVYGGPVDEAVGAISSLMRGERDPIERYGVAINQAAVDAYKAANGLSDLTGEAEAQANAQAALALLYQQTGAAQGQFAEQTGTLAESQQIATAQWENAQAALGEALLPLLVVAAGILADLAEWIKENSDLFTILIAILGGVTAAVWALNIAMTLNPIGLIIVAVGLLIGILVVLIANWDEVVAAFEHGFEQILGWVEDAIGWFTDLFNTQVAADPFAGGNIATTVSVVPTPTAATGRSLARASTTSAGPAQVTNVTVNGALDPDKVARQIDGLLTRRGARNGRIVAGGGRR